MMMTVFFDKKNGPSEMKVGDDSACEELRLHTQGTYCSYVCTYKRGRKVYTWCTPLDLYSWVHH
jgi:hypothetical protein